MSPRRPSVKARQVMRALERAGFVNVRTNGSHRIYQHVSQPKRRTIISDHRGKDVPCGTLQSILDQAGLSVDEFIALL